jgi:hypothetical protein
MSFEHQLRPAFDSLTARLRDDLERHLESAAQELEAHARSAAHATADERALLLAEAADRARAEAREDAERAARERHDAQLAERDTRHREELDIAREQHRERVDQLERDHRDAVARLERGQQEAIERLEREHQRGEHLEQRMAEVTGEHRATLEQTIREHEARLGRTVADAEQRIASALQAADLAAGTRLAEAFRAIDAAGSLSEILNALADAVAHEAARAAIFLAGSAGVRSWKTHGFSVNGGGAIAVPAADAGIIQAALDTREPASTAGDGGDDTGAGAPAFAALTDDRPAIAVPMIVNGEVVAVVYADQGPAERIERASWPSVVEVLARHASRSLEAITAHRLAQTLGAGTTRPRTVARPADVVQAPDVRPPSNPPGASGDQSQLTPAPALAATPALADGATPAAATAPASARTVDDPNAAAQSVARALVAAIRVDHEAEVQAGLRERDLMTRLGGPISRAWAEYEATVPETIRSATNFFHAEMVRTLADGDASLLTPKP